MTVQDQVIRAYEDAREDVYHYLLRLGLDPAQAQEGAQEVFLRLYLALRKGESIRNPRAWVFRVAHNLGLSLRSERAQWEALDGTAPDRGEGLEKRMIDAERMGIVSRALEELSPQQRQCLHLRAEGLKYHEIADTLGIGISTVGEFLSRAIARLRKAVNE